MMKLKNYAIGVENTVLENRKLLFLDVDRLELKDKLLNLLDCFKELKAYLILSTGSGYHVIAMRPLVVSAWRKYLKAFSDLIDKNFYRISLKYERSVLRISPKISTTDAKTITKPAPEFYCYVEHDAYPFTAVSLLYRKLYNYQTQQAFIPKEGLGKAILHYYITVR